MALRQWNKILGSFQGYRLTCEFGARRGGGFHRHGVWVGRDVVRQDQH